MRKLVLKFSVTLLMERGSLFFMVSVIPAALLEAHDVRAVPEESIAAVWCCLAPNHGNKLGIHLRYLRLSELGLVKLRVSVPVPPKID